MATIPARLTRAASILGILRRGFADEAANAFSLTFATPAKVFCSESMVKQVDVPTFSGHLGVLREHVPTIAMLQPGVLVVHGETTQRYFVSSGSIAVNGDSSVQILAEEACLVEDIDIQQAQQGMEKAVKQLASAGADEQGKAEAQVAVDFHEALIQSVKA